MPTPSLTLLRTQSDERLVALAHGGHERAFEAIVERYRRPLLRAARRVLPEARAEDALQQALIAAWTALQRGDEVRDLRAWLYRVVHNTALNALRVNGYDYVELEDTLRLTDAGDDELERRAVVRQTLASLAALPERQREALLRTAVSGYSQEEVARDLGISDNAMRQLIHRARSSMRAAVTAVTPLPLITAIASGARSGPLVDRIAELAAGAAPAGAGVTLAKAGTVAVLAGGAFSGPVLVDRIADRPPVDRTAAAATVAPSRAKRPVTAPRRASTAPATATTRTEPVALQLASGRSNPARQPGGERRSGSGREDAGDGELRSPSSGSGSGDDHSGPGHSGSDHSGSDDRNPAETVVEPSESHSGSGSSGSDDPPEDASDSSGPGGGPAIPVPSATPVAPQPDSHGPGHGPADDRDEADGA